MADDQLSPPMKIQPDLPPKTALEEDTERLRERVKKCNEEIQASLTKYGLTLQITHGISLVPLTVNR